METMIVVLRNVLLWLGPVLWLGATPEVREWTSADGAARFSGTLLEVADETALIRREADQQTFTVPLENLSPSDRDWIQAWAQEQARSEKVTPSSPDAPESMDWPRRIRVGPDYAIEVIEENRAEHRFVYRSNHFEFISDRALARGVVREFGQIFEGTYLSIAAMPLGWNPQPPEGDHFVVRLFAEREAYYAAGGLPRSGGVYLSHRRECLVPFESIGLERLSSTYALTGSSNIRILVHEVTHQVHHEWIARLPIWLVEGLAVYMESVPYERGVFRFDRQNRRNFFLERSGREAVFVPLGEMLAMSGREWNTMLTTGHPQTRQNYATAFLLAWYFFHLEDEGRSLYRYLRAIERGTPEPEARLLLLGDRDVAGLTSDFTQRMQRQGLRLQPWTNPAP